MCNHLDCKRLNKLFHISPIHKCRSYCYGSCPDNINKCNYKARDYICYRTYENIVKLIQALIETDHTVEISKEFVSISNGNFDFVEDCYATDFQISGDNLVKATINYIDLWIEQSTRIRLDDGSMTEFTDTSHKLERDMCVYPKQYDNLLIDIEKFKKHANLVFTSID